ncbi:MAG: amino acid ABC transporter permease [Veillonellaceae bacterium]|nr:amino acid ABC transporter permease [Veillonellaceae bacterium]
MIQELFQIQLFAFLLEGLYITLKIAGFTIVFSVVLGTLLGVARYSGHPLYSRLAAVYIESVRNIPLLLFILAARFMTPLAPVNSGILAMTVFTAGVMAEIIRGGLNSIPQGQWEAARSQGFSYAQTLRYIVLPQTFRNILPPLVSQFTTVIKDTSFVWAVGVEELTGKGMILLGKYGTTAQVFSIFAAIAALYFGVNYLLSVVSRAQQARLAIRGF